MGGRTAYPWLSTPKITVEDRFYINLFSVFRPFWAFRYKLSIKFYYKEDTLEWHLKYKKQ